MIINEGNFDKTTISDWGKDFWEIYEIHDKKRSLADIWLIVNEEAASTCEGIREGNYEALLKSLAHTFCWILSFVNKILYDENVDNRFKDKINFGQIENIIIYKYPSHCLSCWHRQCMCPVLSNKVKLNQETVSKQRERLTNKCLNWSLDEWQEMFDNIYSAAHKNLSISEIGFHFAEEVGEVSTEIRMMQECPEEEVGKYRIQLYEEIADTLSWCFSLLCRVKVQLDRSIEISKYFGEKREATSVTMSRLLWNEYRSPNRECIVCHKCKNINTTNGSRDVHCDCKVKIISC